MRAAFRKIRNPELAAAALFTLVGLEYEKPERARLEKMIPVYRDTEFLKAADRACPGLGEYRP